MSQTVAIIDYGSGNLKSAEKAFLRAARLSEADVSIHVTADPDLVRNADRIVLPGVGAFADCAAGLLAVAGMRETLEDRVLRAGVPFLGICVGMQLMATRGREKGSHQGFDWIGGEVKPVEPHQSNLKVPHMGWNTISLTGSHPLFAGIETGDTGLHAYFVHSYHFVADDAADLLATAEYGGPVTAAIGRDNMVGTQFHPEKSQMLGLTLIGNFLRWQP